MYDIEVPLLLLSLLPLALGAVLLAITFVQHFTVNRAHDLADEV